MQVKFTATAAIGALLATASVPMPMAGAKAASRTQDEGFCRQPASLPQLPPEERERPRSGWGGPPPPPPPMSAPPPPPPPSPPRAPAPMTALPVESATAGEAVVVTGARVDRDAAARVAPPMASSAPGEDARVRPPHPRPYPQPQPQSGLLTAGEHDDLLNPELYAAYVGRSNLGQEVRVLPRVDTMRVVTVKVNDRNGQPIPFAEVMVTCSDGNRISMATQADGSAVFFPGLDRLSERITVSARKAGRQIAAERPALVAEAPGGQTIGLIANDMAERPTKLDLMLVIDTTGSMGDEIRYLQAELRAIIAAISEKHRDLDIRTGFVFYRDSGDEYVTRTVGFERDVGKVQGTLARQSASGGGDYPEAMDQALIRAVGLDWRPDAVKSLLLVADAPPHDDKFGRTWAAAEAARAKRIHITPVAASGVADKAEYAMRAMAAATQSRYLFLTDDSGVGNPHAPPAIDCYLVTRLDALVRRVIDSQISGRRIEPDDSEVIRRVGNYDAGKCILPSDFRWQS